MKYRQNMNTRALTVIALAILFIISGCGTISTTPYDKGEAAYKEKNYCEAVKWWKEAAEQGEAKAQGKLGYCYANGEGVGKDLTEAAKWYKKAAEQGYAKAQSDLGGCYFIGLGVERDIDEAIKWWEKAAEQGDHVAKAILKEIKR